MITKIYGASDDLIEIEGAISDELNVHLKDNEKVSFSASDGTKGKISYENDGWRIELIEIGKCKKINAVGDDASHTGEAEGCTSYSDVLIFENIDWIKIGRKTFKVDE